MYQFSESASGSNGVVVDIAPIVSQGHCLLNLRLALPGMKKKVDKNLITVDADIDAVTASKELLECEEFDAVQTFQAQARLWVLTRALPAHKTLKRGFYRLPNSLIGEVDRELEERKQEWENLVVKFLDVYWQKVEEAKVRLRSLYDAGDYPSLDRMRGAFKFDWSYLQLSVPESLDSRIAAREQEKFNLARQEALAECRDALRGGLSELVDRAVESLKSDKDGNPMRFKSTLVEKMNDFLEYFNVRNIANDTDLRLLVEKTKAVMAGVDTRTLKDNRTIRETIQAKLAEVKDVLDTNLISQKTRSIRLDD